MQQAATLPMRGRTATGTAVTSPGASPWIGIAPCLYYLVIEFGRPMDWIPELGIIKPGMLAAGWALVALLLMKRRPFPRPALYMLAFTALMAIHVVHALNNFVAFNVLKVYWIPMLVCILALSVVPSNFQGMRILLWVYVLAHVPTAIGGIIQSGHGLGGWLSDENDLAFALNAAIGLAIYLFLETSLLSRKVLLAGAIGTMVWAVVSTGSRGGFVGLLAVALYLLLTARRKGPILAFIVLGILAVYLVAPPAYWEEIGTIRTAHQGEDTGGKRLYYWGIAWKMFLDHPLAGVGTDNYGIRAIEYADASRYRETMWRRVSHSLYFTLIAEHGLAGIVLFCLMLLWCRKSYHNIQRDAAEHPDDPDLASAALLSAGLAAALLAVLATGIFLYTLYYPPFWVLVALTGSLHATRPLPRTAPAEALA